MRDKTVILESLESRVLLDADAIPFPIELMDYEPGSSIIVDSFPAPAGVPDDLLQDMESFPHFAVAVSVEVLAQQGYVRLVLEDVGADSDVKLRINGVLSSYAEPDENRDPSERRIGPVPENPDRIEIDVLASDLPVGSNYIEADILSPSDSGTRIAIETRSILLLVQDEDSSALSKDTSLLVDAGTLSDSTFAASGQGVNFSVNADAVLSGEAYGEAYGGAYAVSIALSAQVGAQIYNTDTSEAISGDDTGDNEASSTEADADTSNDGTGIFCIILPRSVAAAGTAGGDAGGVAGGDAGAGESLTGADFSADLNVSLQSDSSVPVAPASGNSPVMSIQEQETFGEAQKPSKAKTRNKKAEESDPDSESDDLPTRDMIVTNAQLTPEDDDIHQVSALDNTRAISLSVVYREGSDEDSGLSSSITADASGATVRSDSNDDFDRRNANIFSSGRVGIWTSVVVAVLGAKLWQTTRQQKTAGGFLPICDDIDRSSDT